MRASLHTLSPRAARRALGWLARASVAVGALFSTGLPAPYVVVGPQQQVITQHPITCVHTRLTDEVAEWKIQHTLEMVREMGAPTIVEFFPWAYAETSPGVYDWGHSDQIVKHARAQGLRIIARLGLVPSWALPKGDNANIPVPLNTLTPDHVGDFANFVEAFTAHYRGQIDAVIVWNEPNLSFEWGYQPVDPQFYVDLLRAAYPAAKRGNPDVVVLGGALAPTLEPEGSSFGMNDLEYLRQIYRLGASPFFDALAVHAYGMTSPPEQPPSPEVLNFRRVELVRQIMVENGDAAKPVFVTESGWNDAPRWVKAVRPSQRITYTLDAFAYAEQNWPWARAVCLWAFRYPAPTHSFPDYYTLVAPDFTPKPIYDEIQRWTGGAP